MILCLHVCGILFIKVQKLLICLLQLTYHQALVLIYDLLCGKGLRVRGFLTKLVFRHKTELRESYKELVHSRKDSSEGNQLLVHILSSSNLLYMYIERFPLAALCDQSSTLVGHFTDTFLQLCLYS